MMIAAYDLAKEEIDSISSNLKIEDEITLCIGSDPGGSNVFLEIVQALGAMKQRYLPEMFLDGARFAKKWLVVEILNQMKQGRDLRKS